MEEKDFSLVPHNCILENNYVVIGSSHTAGSHLQTASKTKDSRMLLQAKLLCPLQFRVTLDLMFRIEQKHEGHWLYRKYSNLINTAYLSESFGFTELLTKPAPRPVKTGAGSSSFPCITHKNTVTGFHIVRNGEKSVTIDKLFVKMRHDVCTLLFKCSGLVRFLNVFTTLMLTKAIKIVAVISN